MSASVASVFFFSVAQVLVGLLCNFVNFLFFPLGLASLILIIIIIITEEEGEKSEYGKKHNGQGKKMSCSSGQRSLLGSLLPKAVDELPNEPNLQT